MRMARREFYVRIFLFLHLPGGAALPLSRQQFVDRSVGRISDGDRFTVDDEILTGVHPEGVQEGMEEMELVHFPIHHRGSRLVRLADNRSMVNAAAR